MKLASYSNVFPLVGSLIAGGKATLNELQTVYTLEDAFVLLEIMAVEAENTARARDTAEKAARKRK